MQLQDFLRSGQRFDTEDISANPDLNHSLQSALVQLGFLKFMESGFGVAATAALNRFQQQAGCQEPGCLGPETAEKVLEALEKGSQQSSALRLTIIQNTVLKAKPLDSEQLADSEKANLATGTVLEITFFAAERSHLRVTLVEPIQNSLTWYIFEKHAQVLENNALVHPLAIPVQTKLKVSYKSQMDNFNNPTGSCNVTCLAMCLSYLGISGKDSSIQLEDELYEYTLSAGLSRHLPQDLAKVVVAYGAKDNFDEFATIDRVKQWIAKGNLVVIHGYFTSFGHIVTLIGYDENGFIVHDPYGEWFESGYDCNDPAGNNQKGKDLKYSYDMITRTCIGEDKSFWAHFISK
jgi:uncharacterized protein YvpB